MNLNFYIIKAEATKRQTMVKPMAAKDMLGAAPPEKVFSNELPVPVVSESDSASEKTFTTSCIPKLQWEPKSQAKNMGLPSGLPSSGWNVYVAVGSTPTSIAPSLSHD